MARCDEGYLCEVCGADVDGLQNSDLYLHYVLGEIPYEQLHRHPERHIRCNPTQAQYIIAGDFEPVLVEGVFDKRLMDAEFVTNQEARYSRAWRRLQEVQSLGISIADYPLSD